MITNNLHKTLRVYFGKRFVDVAPGATISFAHKRDYVFPTPRRKPRATTIYAPDGTVSFDGFMYLLN